MNPIRVHVVPPALALALALGLAAGCKPRPPPPPPPPPVQEAWAPERIAKDPEGYLAYADGQVAHQIKERETRLAALAPKKAEIVGRREAFVRNLDEIENVRRLLQRALDKAVELDEWPIKMAGRTFERERAVAILQKTTQYLEERRPLAQAYDAALDRLAGAETALRDDIEKLGRLRDKLQLDREQVSLNRNTAGLGELKQTEQELASFSHMLVTMDDPLAGAQLPSAKDDATKVDVNVMLK